MKNIIKTPTIGDDRFKQWTKTLKKVDTSKSNGYAFEGEFIRGNQELEVGSYLLAWGRMGSRAHNYPLVKAYRITPDGLVVVYEKDGLNEHWTLDVRDEIAAFVNVNETPEEAVKPEKKEPEKEKELPVQEIKGAVTKAEVKEPWQMTRAAYIAQESTIPSPPTNLKPGERLWLRYGDIPSSGKSMHKQTGYEELGVSVMVPLDRLGHTAWSQGMIFSATAGDLDKTNLYVVAGKQIGEGSDGEPIISAARMIRKAHPLERYQLIADMERIATKQFGFRKIVNLHSLLGSEKPDYLLQHEQHIKQALSEGKPVPAEVLADYPDLQKQPVVSPEQALMPPPVSGMPEAGVQIKKARGRHHVVLDASKGRRTLKELKAVNAGRSPLSRAQDNAKKHHVTLTYKSPKVDKWLKDKGAADIIKIDTPKKRTGVLADNGLRSKRRGKLFETPVGGHTLLSRHPLGKRRGKRNRG